MADDRIRIDELPPEITATLNHLLAAMESGETVNLTVKQVLDLFLVYPQFTGKADTTALTSAITQVRTRGVVRAATTANVTIATALNAGDTIDGVVLADGDLVLVKAQTTGSQNGIYTVAAAPVRSPEYATWADLVGASIVVTEGTVNADTEWLSTANKGGTLNTTSFVFSTPVSLAAQKSAGIAADRLALFDSVTGLLKTLPLDNLARVGAIRVQTFRTSGTYTPHAKLLYAVIEAEGAGGAGGGVAGNSAGYWAGGGGGSGAFVRTIATKATIDASQAVTIGAGGTGTSGNGNAGGATSVGALAIAAGGSFGNKGSSATNPGAGAPGLASASTGDVKLDGRPGTPGIYGGTPGANGQGGNSRFGRGPQGTIQTASGGAAVGGSVGVDGGGGSGAVDWNSATTANGGNGGNGIVVITEFCSE